MTVLARLLTLSIRLLASGGSKLLIMLLVTTPGAFAYQKYKAAGNPPIMDDSTPAKEIEFINVNE